MTVRGARIDFEDVKVTGPYHTNTHDPDKLRLITAVDNQLYIRGPSHASVYAQCQLPLECQPDTLEREQLSVEFELTIATDWSARLKLAMDVYSADGAIPAGQQKWISHDL